MAAFKDITGQRFGRLVVLSMIQQRTKHHHIQWQCLCDCGNPSIANAGNLKQGKHKSCGCLRNEKAAARHYVHGMVGTPEYESWMHAKGRCFNSRNAAYKNYGARGITMCKEWAESFEKFLADMGPCPPKMTLDRIDNNGHYEPGNCRWTTRKIQGRNKRNTVIVIHEGHPIALQDLAEKVGLTFSALRHRYEHGLEPLVGSDRLSIDDRAEIVRLRKGGRTVRQLAEQFGVVLQTIYNVIAKPENP